MFTTLQAQAQRWKALGLFGLALAGMICCVQGSDETPGTRRRLFCWGLSKEEKATQEHGKHQGERDQLYNFLTSFRECIKRANEQPIETKLCLSIEARKKLQGYKER